MYDRMMLVFLGIFLILWAIVNGSNVQIVWVHPVQCIAAAVAGVFAILSAWRPANRTT
jgi:hypothetical protein